MAEGSHWCKDVVSSAISSVSSSSNMAPPPPTPPSSYSAQWTQPQSQPPVAPQQLYAQQQGMLAQQQQQQQQQAMAQYYQQYYYSQQQQQQQQMAAYYPISSYGYPTYAQAAIARTIPATPPSIPAASTPAVIAASIPSKPNPARFAAPVATSAPKAPNASDSSSWPPSLKAFVVRSFNTCQTDDDRAYMQDNLKKLMNKIASEGRLSIHKWDLEPTPQLPRQQQEAAAVAAAAQVSSSSSQPRQKKSRFGEAPTLSVSATNHAPAQSFNQYSPSISASNNTNHSIYGPGGRNFSDHGTADGVSKSGKDSKGKKKGIDKMEENDSKIQQQRAERFKVKQSAVRKPATTYVTYEPQGCLSDADLENLKVVGTCENLEKDYLRLTSPPHPSTVRPERVLKQSLALLKSKWEVGGCEYLYMCSQLKAIRQDLTVQHIQASFTVEVYEFHARVALGSGDMNEYNQCQTQLKQLYASGLLGSENEFVAYRILYYVYLQGNKKYQGGSGDLAAIMKSLSPKMMADPAVQHALQIRKAIREENYCRFFKLFETTPNLGAFILDPMLPTWRFALLQRLVMSCKPSICADYVCSVLGFSSVDEGIEFLRKAGAVLISRSEQETEDQRQEESTSGLTTSNLRGGQSHLDIDTKASTDLDPSLGERDQGLLL